MSHPYMPLYVDDYEAATTHLSVEEDGLYTRLLRLCWREPGCSLPNDHAWIARKVRLSEADFERLGRPILTEFFSVSRGRLVQRRLKAEYDDISRKKSARKQAGKKGGIAKAAKEQVNSPSNASVLPSDTRAFQNQNQNHKEKKEETPEAVASGAPIDLSPEALDRTAWSMAVSLLTESGGASENSAKSLFGRLLRDNRLSPRDLLSILADTRAIGTQDPKSYLIASAARLSRRMQSVPAKRVSFV